MRRLIDDDCHGDSNNERLAELVRATPKIEPDPLRKQRVLERVLGAQRSSRPRLRMTAAAVLLASSSAAAATVGHVAIRARLSSIFSSEPAEQRIAAAGSASPSPRSGAVGVPRELPAPDEHSASSTAPPTEPAASPATTPAEPGPVRPAPAGPPPMAARSAEASSGRVDVERPSQRPVAPAPIASPLPAPKSVAPLPSVGDVAAAPLPAASATTSIAETLPAQDREDAAQVIEAIRALRSDGDGVRSGALLADYLRAHPRGVLAEDALALSIEAAAARHDSASAGEFGRRYLTQFPTGRFRSVAVRALKAGQP